MDVNEFIKYIKLIILIKYLTNIYNYIIIVAKRKPNRDNKCKSVVSTKFPNEIPCLLGPIFMSLV